MAENIYLFVPNIIDYVRIIMAMTAFYYMQTDHILASILYLTSGWLDYIDGYAARMLNQCSRFGYILDMLTDRFTTMALSAGLCYFYPQYMFYLQISMIVDIVSHWIHVQSSLLKGSDSHKKIDLSENPILWLYYNNEIVMSIMCAGNEHFFCMLYITHFTIGPVVPLGPLSFGIFSMLLYLTTPIAFGKFIINLVQLWVGCDNIVSIDIEERKALQENKNN